MRLTGEQALALHDLIEGPLMNSDLRMVVLPPKTICVWNRQEEYLIDKHGHVSVADEDTWKSWVPA